MKKFLTLPMAYLFICANLVIAQEQTGEIFGKVTDTEKIPLPGVTIEARSPSHLGTATTITDMAGHFRLLALRPGSYSITFTLPGFQKLRREKILVRLGKTMDLDVILEQTAIEEEIVVTGESPVVDIRKTATAVNIGKEMFDKLPKGRDFLSIVSLTTGGVNDEPLLGGISMDGASGAENMYFVDGMDTTNMYSGVSDQQVIFEFIEEVQVKSSGYAAEYGGSMGGVVNVITRSGGNEFHGEAGLYFRSDELQGSPRPELLIPPSADVYNLTAEYVTYPEDDWSRYEVGFSLGGYIFKDKLWFYGSFMPRYTQTSRTVEFSLDKLERTTTQKEYTYFAQAKFTAQLLRGLRINASFINDFYKWKGQLAPLDGTGDPEYEFAKYGFDYPGWSASVHADYIVSNDLFFNLSTGYYRTNKKQLVEPLGVRYLFRISNNIFPEIDPSLVRPGGWDNINWQDAVKCERDIKTRLTANLDGTLFVEAAGQHVLKAGAQMVRVEHDIADGSVYDSYSFFWGWSPPGLTLTYGFLAVLDKSGYYGNENSLRWALFLQDSWTIADRLTLNYGVRMEREDIPSYSPFPEYKGSLLTFDFTDKIAPRFGFAYDVFGDSSLKIFGSVGLYYDVMKLELTKWFGQYQEAWYYYGINTLDWTQIEDTDHPDTSRPDLYEFLWGSPYNLTEEDFENIQPDMKPYSKLEYSAGVQTKLGDDFSLTVRFLHNRILWAIEDIGVQRHEGGASWFIGNPGSDYINDKYREILGAEYPPCPKAKRRYYSLSFALDKRFSNNWMAGIHYTWSYLWGNFSGLAGSDTGGDARPNVLTFFDRWYLHRDQNMNETTGKLATDRPHQLKIYGSYSFDFGLTVGLYTFAMSGTPVSRQLLLYQGYHPVGRFTDGRTPFLTRTDLYLEYNLQFGRKYGLQLNANITNLFNWKIARRKYSYYNFIDFGLLSNEKILAGFDYREYCEMTGAPLDPRFMMPYDYTPPIDVRLGVKFIF